MPAQDPEELFDLCDEQGRPLGRSKPRRLVHRDGDWHRSLHLWVVIEDRSHQEQLLLQRRSLAKDTQPGALDLAVAGHLGAGESPLDALREAEEEIGLHVVASLVTRLGVRRRVHACPPVLDREVQEVFFTRTDRTLESLGGDPAEVASLVTLPLVAASSLLSGAIERADARELLTGQRVARPTVLRRAELIHEHDDGYFALALRSIVAHLRGRPEPVWQLG